MVLIYSENLYLYLQKHSIIIHVNIINKIIIYMIHFSPFQQ